MERGKENKESGLQRMEDGGVEVVYGPRIKQSELTGSIVFFSFIAQVFSVSRLRLRKAQQSQRLPETLIPFIHISFLYFSSSSSSLNFS